MSTIIFFDSDRNLLLIWAKQNQSCNFDAIIMCWLEELAELLTLISFALGGQNVTKSVKMRREA